MKQHNIAQMVECRECGAKCLRKDATFYEPFAQEVYGKKVPTILCPECAGKAVWDT